MTIGKKAQDSSELQQNDSAAAPGKSEVRKEFRRRYAAHTPIESAAKTKVLNERLITLLSAESGSWAAFQPAGFEPDIRPALKALTHIDWVFPRVEGELLQFYKIPHPLGDSETQTMASNKWGLLEPNPNTTELQSLRELKGFLVPGVAFDRSCNRLGRGRGFYDRTFSDLRKRNSASETTRDNDQTRTQTETQNPTWNKNLTIGIALDWQMTDQLPIEPHDMPLDCVLTESQFFTRTSRDENGAMSLALPERKNS